MKVADFGIAIVGGGVYAASLCDQITRQLPAEAEIEIELMARDFDRLCVIAEHSRLRASQVGKNCRIRARQSLAEGLDGADVVVLLPRVGGLSARAMDE